MDEYLNGYWLSGSILLENTFKVIELVEAVTGEKYSVEEELIDWQIKGGILDHDETRRVIKRVGKGLSFGRSLFYADSFLWTFSFEAQSFIRINPSTGKTKIFENDGEMLIARGLVFDGEYFWANDFSRLKIIKFIIDGDSIKIIDSFDVPKRKMAEQ